MYLPGYDAWKTRSPYEEDERDVDVDEEEEDEDSYDDRMNEELDGLEEEFAEDDGWY